MNKNFSKVLNLIEETQELIEEVIKPLQENIDSYQASIRDRLYDTLVRYKKSQSIKYNDDSFLDGIGEIEKESVKYVGIYNDGYIAVEYVYSDIPFEKFITEITVEYFD